MTGGECPRIRLGTDSVQAGRSRPAVRAVAVAATLALAGCSSLSGIDPVAWWHDLEGGPVADARPPPPNADAPYPNLASVPDRPTGSDAAQRGQIANALIADRRHAQYDASLAPLPPAGTRLPTPAPIAPPPPASADSEASNASLATASAPPAPVPVSPPAPGPAAPKRAPVPAVQATPLGPVAAAPSEGQAAAPAGALPAIPDQPPPPPALPGVVQATAPTPPPAPPPPPAAAPAAPVASAVDAVAFPAGSGVLPSAALPGLRAIAGRRGGGTVAVLGFGEAAGTEPAAQQAAIPLALARARAIAAALEGAGVPASAIRIDAEAAGQGGVVRLIR